MRRAANGEGWHLRRQNLPGGTKARRFRPLLSQRQAKATRAHGGGQAAPRRRPTMFRARWKLGLRIEEEMGIYLVDASDCRVLRRSFTEQYEVSYPGLLAQSLAQ